MLHVLFLFYKIHVIKCKTLIPKAPVSAVTHFPRSILISLKSKYWAQIYELSFKGFEFRNGYFKMWATVGPDHIYFSNNKKCIIYNTLYLIIHRVYVAAILIGFILKCHISLNFRLKLIGKLFSVISVFRSVLQPLTLKRIQPKRRMAHNRPENCHIIWIFLDLNFSRSLKRNILFCTAGT